MTSPLSLGEQPHDPTHCHRDGQPHLGPCIAVTSYEEWRVTGEPGGGFQPYTFTWSPARGEPDPESAARGFVELVEEHETWADGPYLHRRTVTVTEWEEAP